MRGVELGEGNGERVERDEEKREGGEGKVNGA